jgi:homoserine kinase type II
VAVYTHVAAEELARFIADYDVGTLLSAKGIAEGVENSNYLVETSRGRFILTLYEKRVDAADLPWFMALTTHLAQAGLPVPRPIGDRTGATLRTVAGRPACLIQFLNGVSLSTPSVAQAHATGAALGRLHRAGADFSPSRANALGPDGWRQLAGRCMDSLDSIAPGLARRVADELDALGAAWPEHLDRQVIHADLFPDNVLMLDDEVTGLIDFYFACTDIRAYDLAITHGAWCFAPDGSGFDRARGDALIAGYVETHGLTPAEHEALPILARGACLRFLLTRAWDWLNTPADALVTRKDPIAFLRRLDHYRQAGASAFPAR